MNLYMIATSFKSPPNKFGCQARAQGEAACNLIGEFVEGFPASRLSDKKHRLPNPRAACTKTPEPRVSPAPGSFFIHSRSRQPIDSRRLNQVGCRQVFWLPALKTLYKVSSSCCAFPSRLRIGTVASCSIRRRSQRRVRGRFSRPSLLALTC